MFFFVQTGRAALSTLVDKRPLSKVHYRLGEHHTECADFAKCIAPWRHTMDITTLLIILAIVLLLGGGWYGRGRWFGR